MAWATVEEARQFWADAPFEDDELQAYLQAAYEQCVAFAPERDAAAPLPERYVQANIMQARAIYRSLKAGNSDQIGMDGFSVTIFPMDWTVKALLRPPTGRPVLR